MLTRWTVFYKLRHLKLNPTFVCMCPCFAISLSNICISRFFFGQNLQSNVCRSINLLQPYIMECYHINCWYLAWKSTINFWGPCQDENGNKMVNEYVRECKIGSGSYGKVVSLHLESWCYSVTSYLLQEVIPYFNGVFHETGSLSKQWWWEALRN